MKRKYDLCERTDKFQAALDKWVDGIKNPALNAAARLLTFNNGSYFHYGCSMEHYSLLYHRAKRVSQETRRRILRKVSRMASYYKVPPLSAFDEFGSFKSQTVDRKYMRRLPLG